MKPTLQWTAVLAFSLFAIYPARANVVIHGTRVVYPGKAREVIIQLSNHGTSPSLVQAWLDNGDAKMTPDESNAPFALTPPVFRLNPNKGQALRLMYTGRPLPKDRESLFWLNMLEVPPMPAGSTGKNYLQLAFRSRIKVFFRPPGLPGQANEAPAKLHWHVVPSSDGKGLGLECDNPTPYYVSFSRVGVTVDGRPYAFDKGGMVAPAAKAFFPLAGLSSLPPAGTEVDFTSINDYGGDKPRKSTLER
ncbi:fimbria/pilus periplasmic chaperone [Dyella agri]|uniref:Fimbria/pilus periplasmic chaperone n=2 Tax=Dyella agri TaxID=1926869 RepID=A0ABW8KIP4_9GAMM